jgi:hypothetical protein
MQVYAWFMDSGLSAKPEKQNIDSDITFFRRKVYILQGRVKVDLVTGAVEWYILRGQVGIYFTGIRGRD